MTEEIVPPSTEEKLAEQEILKQAIQEKTALAQDYYDQLLRLRAEFENYRKRVEKEKAQARLWAKQEVLARIIGLHDILCQAKSHVSGNMESMRQGLDLILQEFEKFMESEGLKAIVSQGQHFDPHWHEAVEQKESAEHPDGTILEELQRGYTLNGQLIRPARVKVAVKKRDS